MIACLIDWLIDCLIDCLGGPPLPADRQQDYAEPAQEARTAREMVIHTYNQETGAEGGREGGR